MQGMRNMGAPSIACMLPIANATETTLAFAREEVLPSAKLPVYVGLNVWSSAQSTVALSEELRREGFFGVANFPSCMHYSKGMQRLLDRYGFGIQAEIRMLKTMQDNGCSALFFCGPEQHAGEAAHAGLDAVLFNFG